jgi:hypothetical protein
LWTEFDYQQGQWDFCLHHHIQNGVGTNLTSYPMDPEGFIFGGESSQSIKLTIHLVGWLRMCEEAFPPSPKMHLSQGIILLFVFKYTDIKFDYSLLIYDTGGHFAFFVSADFLW